MKKISDDTMAQNETTDEFLKAAISDLTGNLNLLDTKISIIMATVGVILGLVVACKENILKAYHFYSSGCFLRIVFLSLSALYILTIIATFVCGINCITIRFGKSQSTSLWFFKTEAYGGISEKEYYSRVNKLTNKQITKNLANEVYKLNIINNRKMASGRMTVTLFAVSSAVITILMIMVGIFYLVV